MIRSLLYLLPVLLLAGCVTRSHPVYIGDFDCHGKGVVTVTGNLQLGAGVGGGGSSQGTIQADCGDGFSIHHEKVRPTVPVPYERPVQ